MQSFNQTADENPKTHPYVYPVTEEQFIVGAETLIVPPLSLGETDADYPRDLLGYFRKLWDVNGHSQIRSPHHAVMALPPEGDTPGLVFTNIYRGQTDGQIKDRKPYLKEYRHRSAELASSKDAEERAALKAKLARILKHIPDLNGLQGIEQYQLFVVPSATELPFRYRVSSPGNLYVMQDHRLGPEASTYGLPTRRQSKPYLVYPFSKPSATQLRVDGEHFNRPGSTITTLEKRQRVQRLLSLLQQHSS